MSKLLDIQNADTLNSNNIREYLISGGEHPAELFPSLFSLEPPEVALTYEWKLEFGKIFSFLNDERLDVTRRAWRVTDELSLKTRIWIDILFIDQVWDR